MGWIWFHFVNRSGTRGEGGKRRQDTRSILADRAVLCHGIRRRALSDYVYFPEGRFASGSPGMNGELISPTETSQSLHIYSPPFAVTSPWLGGQWRPGKPQMSLTQSKDSPYIQGTSIPLKAPSGMENK